MNLEIDDITRRNTNKSWWRRRTSTQRTIILFVAIAITVVTFFILAMLVARTFTSSPPSMCLTPGCIRASAQILKYINPLIDPCEDFHQFACGQFLTTAIIPEGRTMLTSYSDINELLEEKLKIMLLEPVDKIKEKPFVMLKQLFSMCMNVTAIENIGLANIKRALREFGGWPILDGENWNERKFDWMESIYKCKLLGIPAANFLGLSVTPHPNNATKRILEITEAPLSVNRINLLNGFDDRIVKGFYNLLLNYGVSFGANRTEIEEDVKEVVQFQMSLAKLTLSSEEKRNITSLINLVSVEEVQRRFPSIPWLYFLNKVLVNATRPFKANDTVVLTAPKYIAGLEVLLQNTTKRVQSNYAIFRVISGSALFLTENMTRHMKEFLKISVGAEASASRQKECAAVATSMLEIASASMYVRKYFKQESKTDLKEMVVNIQNEFRKILKQADWMDEVTRQKAKEKADTMVVHIGYPDELLNDKALEEYYSGLNAANDYYSFALNIFKFQTDKNVKKLWEPVNRTEWTTRTMPTTLNAGYKPMENSIELPAAIFQGIFFEYNRPRYLNYGGIGYVIGHEITHGFDDRGRQFDKNGNIFDWWEENTNQAFKQKSQCIVDQYGNYTIPEILKKVNGILTQGENIADNAGIKEAYRAYNEWVKHNYEEPLLPGVNYTTRQMFWISSAILWCSKERSEVLEHLHNVDSHPPARFRIQGPLSNSEEFANDFKCPLGSKMNPAKKCNVW